jgi:DNA replication and repair protein RecF
MRLTHLSLTNFRNFARLDIDVPGGSVLLMGDNAQGKTSLLESIYYLATYVSFHASHDRELLNFMEARKPLAVARIVADFLPADAAVDSAISRGGLQYRDEKASRADLRRLEIRLIQETNDYNGASRLRKEILLDGVRRKVGEAVGAFNAVLFLPQMLRIVEGSPEERRRYLNLAIGQVKPSYLDNLSLYNRTLSQRNALLKQLNDRGGDTGQLTYWDEQLADYGSRVIYARIHAIQELERLAARTHNELTRGDEVMRLSYQPAYDPLPQPPLQYALPLDAHPDRTGFSLEQIQQGFYQSLIDLRDENVTRGVTTIGPHRDEMRFLSNGIDLGTYGSRGQGRTAVLSLKLAEVAWMKEKTRRWPVLLLDEVLAELDPGRREDLLSRLSSSEQVILTTTDLELFSRDFVERAHVWEIRAGRLFEAPSQRAVEDA